MASRYHRLLHSAVERELDRLRICRLYSYPPIERKGPGGVKSTIVLLPFSSSLLGEYGDHQIVVIIYAVHVAIAGLTLYY